MSKKALEELRSEIDRTPVSDEAQRARIEEFKQRLDDSLDESNDRTMPLEDLEQVLILFGEDHPRLAAAIRSAIAILSEGGV